MCKINCSGGCPDCSPEDHTFVICDWCGATIPEVYAENTGSFGYSGKICVDTKRCNPPTLLIEN